MSKRFIEIQQTFPPAPLTPKEAQVLKKYEQSIEVSIKKNDLNGVLQNPPYPYYKRQFWRKLQWMQVDIETKIQSIEKHAQNVLNRYQESENPKDYQQYAQLIMIVCAYREHGLSNEMLIALYSSQHVIPKKLFPYEMGNISLIKAVKYGFIEEFLAAEAKLTALQIDAHNNIIKKQFHRYHEE